MQYKANLHCHTVLSDGKWTAEQVKEEYKKRGYSVVAITDHERLVSHNDLTDNEFLFLTAYEAYIRNFPFDAVRDGQSHINLYSKTPENKMLYYTPNHTKYIPEEELEKLQYHYLVENREFSVPFLKRMIEDAHRCGFLVCHNHPTWSFEDQSYADAYEKCFAMEIYNHSAYMVGHSEYNEHFYDYQLNRGRKENFPIIMHISQPPYFWDKEKQTPYFLERGWAFDETHPTFAQLHEEILSRLEKNPKLNFTLAHWGFLTFDKKSAEKFMSYPNTMLDVCPGGDNFLEIEKDKEYWIPFIEKYQDRITYGTDSYNFEYENEEQWLKATGARPGLVQNFFMNTDTYNMYGKEYKGIGVSKEIQEKIFYENLNKMMGVPKAIDYDYLLGKVEELIQGIDENHFEYRNLWCMKHDFESMKKGVFAYK